MDEPTTTLWHIASDEFQHRLYDEAYLTKKEAEAALLLMPDAADHIVEEAGEAYIHPNALKALALSPVELRMLLEGEAKVCTWEGRGKQLGRHRGWVVYFVTDGTAVSIRGGDGFPVRHGDVHSMDDAVSAARGIPREIEKSIREVFEDDEVDFFEEHNLEPFGGSR